MDVIDTAGFVLVRDFPGVGDPGLAAGAGVCFDLAGFADLLCGVWMVAVLSDGVLGFAGCGAAHYDPVGSVLSCFTRRGGLPV